MDLLKSLLSHTRRPLTIANLADVETRDVDAFATNRGKDGQLESKWDKEIEKHVLEPRFVDRVLGRVKSRDRQFKGDAGPLDSTDLFRSFSAIYARLKSSRLDAIVEAEEKKVPNRKDFGAF